MHRNRFRRRSPRSLPSQKLRSANRRRRAQCLHFDAIREWSPYSHSLLDRPRLVRVRASARPVTKWRRGDDTLDITVSTHQAEIMRTTVTLDTGPYQAGIAPSRSSGERLGRVLSTLARRGMMASRPPARRASKRFPTFEVAPDAPVIDLKS